jgi:hypothetical protein
VTILPRFVNRRFVRRACIGASVGILLVLGMNSANAREARHQQQVDKLQVELFHSQGDKVRQDRELQNLYDQTETIEQQRRDLETQNKDLQQQLSAKAERRAAEARLARAVASRSDQAAVAVEGSVGPCSRFRGLFEQYAWDVNTAIAICMAESSGNTTIVSPTDDHGLMQINHGLSIYGTQIYDPAFNIKVAYEQKYSKGGWKHWTVYKTGRYLDFLL